MLLSPRLIANVMPVVTFLLSFFSLEMGVSFF